MFILVPGTGVNRCSFWYPVPVGVRNVYQLTIDLGSEGQSYVGVLPGGKQCYISKKHYPVIVDAFVKS